MVQQATIKRKPNVAPNTVKALETVSQRKLPPCRSEDRSHTLNTIKDLQTLVVPTIWSMRIRALWRTSGLTTVQPASALRYLTGQDTCSDSHLNGEDGYNKVVTKSKVCRIDAVVEYPLRNDKHRIKCRLKMYF